MSQVYVTPVSAAFLPVTVLEFSSITGVPDSIETTLVTHTVLGDETIGDMLVGGTDYARFNIYINTVLQFVVRTGPARYGSMSIQRPLQFSIGDIIDIKVIHYNTAVSADFEATILGI